MLVKLEMRSQLTLIVFSLAVTSQSLVAQEQALQFEAVSVKVAAPDSHTSTGGDPGRIDWRAVNMQYLLRIAYGVGDFQIQGPEWLTRDKYDVTAATPEGVSGDRLPEMLRALLADRFNLSLHRVNKEIPAYALIVGHDGLKMKRTQEAPRASTSGGISGSAQTHHLTGISTVEQLRRMITPWVDRPVVDLTGLEGAFEFSLDFVTFVAQSAGAGSPGNEDASHAASEPGMTVYDAVSKQLGLVLEARKLSFDCIAIDHAERVPSEPHNQK